MPLKNLLVLLFIVLSSKILLAQTPYKYDPNTSNGIGALNDLNWETTTPAFFDDMGDNTNSLNLWLYRSPDGQYLTEGVFYAAGYDDLPYDPTNGYNNWDNFNFSSYSYTGLSHSVATSNNTNFHKLRLDLMRDLNNAPQPRLTFYTTWVNGRLIKNYPFYHVKNSSNQWVPTTNPPLPLYHKFYSAIMVSKSRFKYGYFEARFKVNRAKGNANQGIGQCFWLYPFGGFTPRTSIYSEIDIAEIDAVKSLTTSNIHYRQLNEPDEVISKAVKFESDDAGTKLTFQENWQTFSCEWTPEEINIYFNGILMAHFEGVIVSKTNNLEKPKFLDEMNIILDIEGTDLDHPGGHKRFDNYLDPAINQPNLPFEFDIDYVKVYKLKNIGCEQAIIAQNSYNFSNYQHGLKKSIRFGLENCSNCSAVVNQQNISLRAADGISLEDGFEVTANSNTEFFATVNGDCNK